MRCLDGGVPVHEEGVGMVARCGESADKFRAAQQDGPGEDPAGIPDGETRQEIPVARKIRARSLASGHTPAEIAAIIHDECGPVFGTTWIRAHRLALGIALADVAAQIRARYQAEGRTPPRFSETLLSAYESAQKRPGPEYLHYLCAVYQADPEDLGYQGPCFCGSRHRRPGARTGPDAIDATGAAPGLAGSITRPGPGSSPAAPPAPAVAAPWTRRALHGMTSRWLSAVPPVPEPRDGTAAVGPAAGGPAAGGLPSAWAAAGRDNAQVTPVTLMPAGQATACGAGPDARGRSGR